MLPDAKKGILREFDAEDRDFKSFIKKKGMGPANVVGPPPARAPTFLCGLDVTPSNGSPSRVALAASQRSRPRSIVEKSIVPPVNTLSFEQLAVHYVVNEDEVLQSHRASMHHYHKKAHSISSKNNGYGSESGYSSGYDNAPRHLTRAKSEASGYENSSEYRDGAIPLPRKQSMCELKHRSLIPEKELKASPIDGSPDGSVILIDEDDGSSPRQQHQRSRRDKGPTDPSDGTLDDVDIEACSRDWNGYFQDLIESGCMTPFEASERARKIKKLQDEFCQAVLPVANVILKERDAANKTLATADAGGKAGGDKYIIGNVFFKFCNNSYTESLYGGFENSIKSATLERQGVNAFVACNAKRLRVPLCMVVTFQGQRLWVSTLIPVDENSLKYGSQDAGRTVVADDTTFALMRTVARAMNLKGHYVGSRGEDLTLLFGPVDMEIHLARDARLYVIDTARLFPPDPNVPWRDNEKFYMFRQLRAELVAAWDVPLSSDAYSPFGHCHRHVHDEEVRRAARHLVESIIPTVSPKIAIALCSTGNFSTMIPITQEMHRYGINMRYIGLVLECFILASDKGPPNKYTNVRQVFITHLVAEMIARTIKVQFLIAMRRIPTTDPTRQHHAATCELFNNVFSGTTISREFHKQELLPMMYRKFNPGIKGRGILELTHYRDLLPPDVHIGVYALAMQRSSVLCGIQWNIQISRDHALLNRLGKGTETSAPVFTVPLLRCITPVVKFCEISAFANVLQLVKNGCLEEAEKIYQSELQNREVILGDSPPIVPLLDSLASLYVHPKWNNERIHELIQTRKRIVKIYQDRMPEEEHVQNYVSALLNLGELYFTMHNYAEAQSIWPTALHVAVERITTASVVLGRAYYCNGRLHDVHGRYPEAMKHYDTAATVCGTRDPDIAAFVETVMQARAKLHFTLENEKLATDDAREALLSIQSRMADNVPGVALCKGVVASVIYIKQPEEAIVLCREAMDVVRAEYGVKSPQMATLLATLSRATLHSGRVEEGYRLCEESLSMLQLLGTVGLAIADTLVLLAKFFYFPYHEPVLEVGGAMPLRLNSARTYLMQARDMYTALLKNSSHPKVALVNTMLCDIHRIARQNTDSVALGREALTAFESHQLYYPCVADAMVALGRAFCSVGHHPEAVQMYYHALGLYEETGCSYFLVVELLMQCLPHTRSRHAAPLLNHHAQAAKLDVTLRMIGFCLHHKNVVHASLLVRQAMSAHKDLFPTQQPWNPDSARFEAMFHNIYETATSVRLPGDDVVGELRRFTERETRRQNEYKAEALTATINIQREEDARRTARQHSKLAFILKQIRTYSLMGKERNALNMFVYALESFSQLWPMGAVPNDEVSIGKHNELLELIGLLTPTPQSASVDIKLFHDTVVYVRQCLGTSMVLDDNFLAKPLETFEFLRHEGLVSEASSPNKKQSWVFPHETPRALSDVTPEATDNANTPTTTTTTTPMLNALRLKQAAVDLEGKWESLMS